MLNRIKNKLSVQIRKFRFAPGVYIVTYHHITDSIHSACDQWGEPAIGKISTDTLFFKKHIDFYRKHFELIGLERALSILQDGSQQIKDRYLTITFDDGYKSVLNQAYRKIFEKNSIPLTIFLIGNTFLGRQGLARLRLSYLLSVHAGITLQQFNSEFGLDLKQPMELFGYWKDNYCLKFERLVHDLWALHADQARKDMELDFFITRDDLGEFDPALVSFGSHTWDHAMLSRVDDTQLHSQIAGCHTRLEEVLQRKLAFFAYPYGGKKHFDNRAQQVINSMESVFGFSCYGGLNQHLDRTDVRRIGIGNYSVDQVVNILSSSGE